MTDLRTARTARPGTAQRLAALVEDALGAALPVRPRAWDGSEAGPADGPVVVVRSRRALRRPLRKSGELGLAQAHAAGELDIEGDLGHAPRTLRAAARERGPHAPRPSLADRTRAAAEALRLGAVGPRPAPPAAQARLRGGLHSRARDRAAISHHHDLSNDFSRLLLGSPEGWYAGLERS
ncbi:hypothetical protein [Streptomyces sp. NPDC060002]|uniref:hypothetical protein n=1 Tax=Streptomyces sp. NPDC060002 TaxID=3347033 RepID=UPI0036CBEF8A